MRLEFPTKGLDIALDFLQDLFHGLAGCFGVVTSLVLGGIEQKIQKNGRFHSGSLVGIGSLGESGNAGPSSFGVLLFVKVVRGHAEHSAGCCVPLRCLSRDSLRSQKRRAERIDAGDAARGSRCEGLGCGSREGTKGGSSRKHGDNSFSLFVQDHHDIVIIFVWILGSCRSKINGFSWMDFA